MNDSPLQIPEDGWRTNGAQEFPSGGVTVDVTVMEAIVSDSSVVYIGGSLDDQLLCFLT